MISLNSSMTYDIGYTNTFSPNHDESYSQRDVHTHTINQHDPLSNIYASRAAVYPPGSDMRAHSYAIPRASGRQPSLLTSQPTAVKVIPDVYEIYDTKDFNANRRLSVNGFEMRPRQLSRSGECVFDPVPTYHGAYGPQAESIPFEASQQYIHEQSRLTSDDTSSTNSSVGDR